MNYGNNTITTTAEGYQTRKSTWLNAMAVAACTILYTTPCSKKNEAPKFWP